MAIELPRRGGGGAPRQRGITLPTAGDVPKARIARDPGVRVPSPAGGPGNALADAAQALQEGARISQGLAAKKRKQQVSSASAQAAAELQNFTLDLERDPDYQTYGERFDLQSEEIRERYSEGLDGPGVAAFNTQFQKLSLESAYRVRRLSNIRTVDAGVADLDMALDGYATIAGRASTPEEHDEARTQAALALAKAVHDGFITEEDSGKRQRKFLGQVDEVAALQLLAESPAAAVDALSDADTFPNLDEKRRLAIVSAAKADIKQEKARQEALAGRAVADAQFVLSRGRVPSNLASVQEAAKGTKYEAGLNAAINNRQAVQDFMALPLTEQAQELRGVDRQGVATRTQVEQDEAKTRAFRGLATMVQQGNGLQAAAEAGAIGDVVELDFNDPASLRARAVQAEISSQWAGAPVSPFLDSESDALAGAIDTASPSEVTQLMSGLHEGLGADGAGLVAASVAPKRPELAAAITLVPDDPLTARDIVQGSRLMRENPDVKPGKAGRVPAVETVYGNLFTPESAGALNAYMEAGTALYAARKIPTGDLTFDADAYEQALRDVAGNPVEINGRTILPPVPGMDEGAVEDLVEGLIQPDLIEYGNGVPMFADGSPFTVDLFDRGFFSTDAQLVTAGPGRYLVFMEGLGYVQSDSGGAYVLDLGSKVR